MEKFIDIKSKPLKKVIKSTKDGINVTYMSNLLDENIANKYFRILEKKLKYNSAKESEIKIYGKSFKIPREQVAYGEPDTYYKFSGIKVKAKSWNMDDYINNDDDSDIVVCKVIQNIKKKAEEFSGKKFNFVLINRYKDGNSYISYHADDEDQLGDKPCIVGVSLGEPRDFLFKHKDPLFKPKTLKENEVPICQKLDNGSIVIMEHPTNKYWKHSIPKRASVKKPRISLTFRVMG